MNTVTTEAIVKGETYLPWTSEDTVETPVEQEKLVKASVQTEEETGPKDPNLPM